MRQQLRSWVMTGAMTFSRGWFLQTHSRPRPWWTLSEPWAGLTSPPLPRRAVMERKEWRPSHNSPKKQVRKGDQCWALCKSFVKIYIFCYCLYHLNMYLHSSPSASYILYFHFMIKCVFCVVIFHVFGSFSVSSPVSCGFLVSSRRRCHVTIMSNNVSMFFKCNNLSFLLCTNSSGIVWNFLICSSLATSWLGEFCWTLPFPVSFNLILFCCQCRVQGSRGWQWWPVSFMFSQKMHGFSFSFSFLFQKKTLTSLVNRCTHFSQKPYN